MDDKNFSSAPQLLSSWEAYGYEAITYLTLTPDEAAAGLAAPLTFYDASGRPYTLTLLVPPGTCHGQRLLLAGAGGPARRGMRRGDLTVVVRVSEQAEEGRPTRSAAPPHRLLPRKMAIALLFTVALLIIVLAGIALALSALLQFAHHV
jgi:hypothetical protein